MKSNKKNNLTRKNYIRQLRVLVFFGFLFFSHAFSQQIKSDSLIHLNQHISESSNSEIFVANGTVIYNQSTQEKGSVNKLNESNPVIYLTEGALFYAQRNTINVSIVKAESYTQKEAATKNLVKKTNTQQHKIALEKKIIRSFDVKETYTPSSDDSNFGIGTIAKNIGIFYNTVSKSKKVIQYSTEYPILNNFNRTQKRNSKYGVSFNTFQNCECHFTRPPPYFS